MNHDITVTATVTTDQALSVLETWESQAGYWELKFRKHAYDKHEGYARLVSVQCQCVDSPGLSVPVERDWWIVDQHTVIEGIKRILAGGITNCEDQVAALLRMGEIEMVDADQADAIVQAGLFGELVYG